jgi:membrane protease YdiL (CAAX protease family)
MWLGLLLELTQETIGGHRNFGDAIDYGSTVSTSLTICIAVLGRPGLLRLSRWKITWLDILTAVPLAILVQAVPLLFVTDAREYFFNGTRSVVFLIWVVIAIPILEETLCRGVLLKSLKSRLPSFVAILLLSTLISAGHPVFLEALPRQILLCIVYVALRDSLAASITFHIVMNGFVFLPIGGFFQHWHIYTLWH